MAVQWTVTDLPEVLKVLNCEACCYALMEVKQLIPVALHGVQDPTPPKRESDAKWSEVTILDKTLPMHQYLEEAILLFPKTVTGKGMGPVLKAVARCSDSHFQGAVIRVLWRRL